MRDYQCPSTLPSDYSVSEPNLALYLEDKDPENQKEMRIQIRFWIRALPPHYIKPFFRLSNLLRYKHNPKVGGSGSVKTIFFDSFIALVAIIKFYPYIQNTVKKNAAVRAHCFRLSDPKGGL